MTGDLGFTAEALRLVETKAFTAQLCEELRQVLREESNAMKQSTPGWCRQFQQTLAEHTVLLQQLLQHRAGPGPPPQPQERPKAKGWGGAAAPGGGGGGGPEPNSRADRPGDWAGLVPSGAPRRDEDPLGLALEPELASGGPCWDLEEIEEELRAVDVPESPAARDFFEAPVPKREPPALDRMLLTSPSSVPRHPSRKTSPQPTARRVSKAWTGNQSPMATSEAEVAETPSEKRVVETLSAQRKASFSQPSSDDLEGHFPRRNSASSWTSWPQRGLFRTTTEHSRDSFHQKERDRQEWDRHLQNRVTRVLEDRGSTVSLHEDWSQPIRRLHSRLSQVIEGIATVKRPQRMTTPMEVVQGLRFQMTVAFIIMLNAAFLGYTSNVSMVNTLDPAFPEDPAWFRSVNTGFTVVFALEVLLRVSVMRCAFWLGREKWWNIFDSVLALSSVAEEVVQDIGMSSLRVVRGLRMLKVLRIIRVMRFFRDLRLMACSIMQSLGSLTWAMILLILIMYLFTVFFMQGAISYLRDEISEELPGNTLVRQGVIEYYGNVPDTMYTLLASITSGVSWREVVRPLEEISFMYRLCFCFYVVFVVIGVLNVLTGIFVERACELSGLDKDLVIQSEMTRGETFLVEMKRIFEEADADGSGTISWEEFKRYLQNDRVKAYLATQQLDAFDARTLFDILNINCEEEIGIEKFIVGCQRLRGQARSVDLVAVLQETRSANARLKAVMRRLDEQGREVQMLRARRPSTMLPEDTMK